MRTVGADVSTRQSDRLTKGSRTFQKYGTPFYPRSIGLLHPLILPFTEDREYECKTYSSSTTCKMQRESFTVHSFINTCDGKHLNNFRKLQGALSIKRFVLVHWPFRTRLHGVITTDTTPYVQIIAQVGSWTVCYKTRSDLVSSAVHSGTH
jgi:hypothetical protein